jgi:hypothetical protein
VHDGTCLFASRRYTGDPTSPHYAEETGQGGEEDEEKGGLGPGDIAAIVLGIVLLGVICAGVALFATGRLRFGMQAVGREEP